MTSQQSANNKPFTSIRWLCIGTILPGPKRILASLVFLVSLSAIVDTQASAGGRSGFSGDPSTNGGATCSVCHAPDGASIPAIQISGPSTMDAGTTHDFTVVILFRIPLSETLLARPKLCPEILKTDHHGT